MFKVRYEYGHNRKFLLCPYTTSQEKDLLLLDTVSDNEIELALEIVGHQNIDMLSSNEKIALLFKYREISVGNELSIGFKCASCNAGNDNVVDIENIVKPGTFRNDLFVPLTDDNIHLFLGVENINEMEIEEYERVFSEVDSSITKFNFILPSNCQRCKHINYIDVSKREIIVNMLSEDSLMSLYQTYSDLVVHGNYTKQDVDSLYPFERAIFIGLLNKALEGKNSV